MLKFCLKLTIVLSFIGFLLLISSCSKRNLIVQEKYIQFDSLREALSLAYMQEHHGIQATQAHITPKIIVIHHTVIPELSKTFLAFDPPTLPGNRAYIQKSSSLNVSSQFGVDRDGSIYRFLPDTVFARHVIGLNHCAIGIENVGGTPDLPLTKAQLRANVQLVRYLANKYDIRFLIGHHEYQAFIGHELWKESDPEYLTEKNDPGDLFMQKLRKRIKPLTLPGPPSPIAKKPKN